MMVWTVELINRASTHSGEAEIGGGIGGREPQGSLGNLQEVHPLWEETVQMDRVNNVCGIQTRQGFLRKVANQGTQEEALG